MVDQLRSGLAAQLGIATENETALNTIVTPNTFIEFGSESIERDTVQVGVQGLAGTLFPRTGRRRTVFRGAQGDISDVPVLTIGLARLLRHCFGGYVFSWPGSTNGAGTLTLAAAAANNDTMTIGSQTYTFKTTLTSSGATANEIKVASSIALQTSYIAAAINRGMTSDGLGPGEAYGSATRLNPDVTAVAGATTVVVTDKQGRGAAVNSGGGSQVATTETFTNASSVWGAATLAGGANGTDTARLHTFTFDGSALRELAMTLQLLRPATETSRKAWTYAGGKVISWELSIAGDGALMLTPTVHLRSESLVTAAATATYSSTATFYDFTQTTFTIDGTSEPIQGFTLSADLGLATDRTQLGTTAPRNQLINARPNLNGSFEREFENRNLYDAWIAGTAGALVLTATGGTIPSSASTFQTVLTMPSIRWMGATPNVSGPEIVRKPIPFEVMDDGTNAPVTLTYRTSEGYVGGNG